MNLLRRTCARVLASVALLLPSSAGVHAQVVYSSRVYSNRGHSWHQLREIRLSDGKEMVLTDSKRPHYNPRCTLDGTTIFFLSSESESDGPYGQEIWRLDRSTRTESLVFKPSLPTPSDNNFSTLGTTFTLLGGSPDGRTLFFLGDNGEVDKFDVKQTRLGFSWGGSVVLSRDATRLALVGEDRDLRVIDTNGRVLADFGNCGLPAWSKDGDQLACVSEKRAVQTIDVAHTATTRSIALPPQGDHWDFATSITWNPDGRSLLVGSYGGDSTSPSDDYWLLNLANGNWKYIDRGNAAHWSGDGSAIIYTSPRDLAPLPGGKHQVWVSQLKSAEMSTLRIRILVGGLSYNEDPQWCPQATESNPARGKR